MDSILTQESSFKCRTVPYLLLFQQMDGWMDGLMLTVGEMWLTWVFSQKVRVAPWRPKGELETSSREASMGCMTEQLYRTLTSALPLGKNTN